MGMLGRPTPQPERTTRPRFRDLHPTHARSAEINPFLASHREFGRELIPADQAHTWHGRWHEFFGREAPLHIEIGSGNGFFLSGMAARHRDWDFVGVELRYKRVELSARKLRKAEVTNATVVRYDAVYLDDLFTDGCARGVYVNHPDPWAKMRHEKNRILSRWFLEEAVRLLQPGGWLRIKSDFAPNVNRVAKLIPGLPLRITGRAEDVTRGPAPWPDDIETNYQRKMRQAGIPVLALELVRESA